MPAAHAPAGGWVAIDEIQKVPALLDEVHRLIELRRMRFVLSGSSARKLRRGGTNLLAGRADMRRLYPLVSAEMGASGDSETPSGYTAIEVKAATGWRSAASRGPARVSAELGPKNVRSFGAYLGARGGG